MNTKEFGSNLSYISEFSNHLFHYYGNILSEEEECLLRFLETCPAELARTSSNLMQRRTNVFSNKEMGFATEELDILINKKIITPLDVPQKYLSYASKSTLLELCKSFFVAAPLSASKPKIINHINLQLKASKIGNALSLFEITGQKVFRALLLLFFGNSRSNFRQFFIRDRAGERPVKSQIYSRIVTTREQFEAVLNLEAFKNSDELEVSSFLAFLRTVRELNYYGCHFLHQRVEKSVSKFAVKLEKMGQLIEAVELFEQDLSATALASKLRCLKKLKIDSSIVSNLKITVSQLELMEERKFALQSAEVLVLTHKSGRGIEQDVCSELAKQGIPAFHTENFIVNWLYRQFCSQVLSKFVLDAHPLNPAVEGSRLIFSRQLPHYFEREISLALSEVPDWFNTIQSEARCVDEPLQTTLINLDAQQIQSLLGYIFKNPYEHLKGFPDLTVFEPNGTMKFIEVKGTGDILSKQQITVLKLLEDIGLRAIVIKAVYLE